MNVGIKEAKTNLSKLIADAQQGKRVYLTNQGKRVIELVPVSDEPVASDRGLGMFKHKIHLPVNWGTQEARREETEDLLKSMNG